MTSQTEAVEIRMSGRTCRVDYVAGDTILDTATRAGLRAPSSCRAGNCGTCMAHLSEGQVAMRANNVLSESDLEEGWILTCQAVPTSPSVVIDYDR